MWRAAALRSTGTALLPVIKLVPIMPLHLHFPSWTICSSMFSAFLILASHAIVLFNYLPNSDKLASILSG